MDIKKDKGVAEAILRHQIVRFTTLLFTDYLAGVEDLKFQHQQMIGKILPSLTEEQKAIVNAADFFDENFHAQLRKRVLDKGNGIIRELTRSLDKMEVAFSTIKKETR